MYIFLRIAMSLIQLGLISAAGGYVLSNLVGLIARKLTNQKKKWAQKVIEDYTQTILREMEKSRSLAYAGLPGKPPDRTLIEADRGASPDADPGMEIQTEDQTWNLPTFYVDTHMSMEENEDSLREHLDLYAPDMPQGPKEYMIEQFVKHAIAVA